MADSTTTFFTGAPLAGRNFKRFAAAALLAVTAATSLSVMAQPMGRHHGGDGFGGPGLFMGSPDRIDKGVDRMLDRVGGATDAQRSQIKAIAKAAADDLRTQHVAGKGLHDRSIAIFAAPTVDSAAAESVRQQRIAQADTSSRRILQAMLDIANVLTPAQRATIGAAMKDREAKMLEHRQKRDAAK